MKIPRAQALKKSKKVNKEKIPVFALKYDPRLPSIPEIVNKHWRAMICQDQHLKEVFKCPPITAFKRQKNLKDKIIRAKVADPPNLRPKRQTNGMKRCGKMCSACPYIKEGKDIDKFKGTEKWKINKPVNCETRNIVYLIECLKCNKRYIGESKRALKDRLADHRGYVSNEYTNIVTGSHFNQPVHALSHLSITIIEKQKNENEIYRKEREKYFIDKFNTHYKGLNRQN